MMIDVWDMDSSYLTQLDSLTSASVVERVLSRNRYEVSQRKSAGCIHVICRSNQPWFRILVGAKPQHLRWTIQSSHCGTIIELQSQYARWYATILAFMVPLSLLFWYVTTHWLLATKSQEFELATTKLTTFIFTVGIAIFLAALIIADGSQTTSRLVRAIRDEIRSQGFEFERQDSGTWSCHMKLAFLYMSLLLTAAIAAIIQSGFVVTHGIPLMVTLSGGSLVAALIGVLLIAGKWKGASERCVMMLPAINTVVALDFLLGTLIVPYLMGRVNYNRWHQAIEGHPNAIKFAVISLVIFPVIALIMITRGLSNSQEIARVESDIKARFDTARAKAAMTASGYLRILRAMLVVIWITLTGPLVVVTTIAVIEFASWVLTVTTTGPVAATSWTVAYLLDQEPTDRSVIAITNALWISFLLIILIPFAVSIGQFGRRMHLLRRWAKQSTRHEYHELLNNVANELASRATIDPLSIIIRPGKTEHVSAQVIGFRRVDRVILIGDKCVEFLDTNELRALIAHETAHHLNGDCFRHFLLQFLARLTLMGDGFVAVLEHSLQYEENADRTAIQRFGIDPRHLASCIRKMSALSSLESLQVSGGLEFHDKTHREVEQSKVRRISHWSKFTASVRLWWRYYTCDTKMGYWHPSLPDRLALLDSMGTDNIINHARDSANNA